MGHSEFVCEVYIGTTLRYLILFSIKNIHKTITFNPNCDTKIFSEFEEELLILASTHLHLHILADA